MTKKVYLNYTYNPFFQNPIFRLFSEQDDATDAEQEGKGELRPVESEHRIGGPNLPLLVAAWVRVLYVL